MKEVWIELERICLVIYDLEVYIEEDDDEEDEIM